MEEIKEEIRSNLVWLFDEGFSLEFIDTVLFKNTIVFRLWKPVQNSTYSFLSSELFKVNDIFGEVSVLLSFLNEQKKLKVKNIYIMSPIGGSFERIFIKPNDYFDGKYSAREVKSIVFYISIKDL
jgi:hypothetical protein